MKSHKRGHLRLVSSTPSLDPRSSRGDAFPQTAAELRERLAGDPEDETLLFELGRILTRDKLWDEAADVYRKLAQLVPDHAQYHFDLGRCLYQLRQLEPAIVSLSLAIKLEPFGPAGRQAVVVRMMAENLVAGTRSAPEEAR